MKKQFGLPLAVIGLWALFAPTCAVAQTNEMDPGTQPCSEATATAVVEYWRAHMTTKALPHADNVQRSLCKINPANPAETIVVIGPDGQSDETAWTELAIVDTATNRIIAAGDAQLVSGGPEDIGIAPVRIDTARYKLANGVRAFGLDAQDGYWANCGDGYMGPSLYLYVREGSRIRPVLKGLYLSESRFIERANDRCSGAVDPGTPSITGTKQLSIAIASTWSHGYHDLLITAHCSRDPALAGSHPERGPTLSRLLHYNGKEYPNRWEDELGCDDRWSIAAVVVTATPGTSVINTVAPKTLLPSTPVQIVAREPTRVLVQRSLGESWWVRPDAVVEASAFKRMSAWHGPATFKDDNANDRSSATYNFQQDGSYSYEFENSNGPSQHGSGQLWEYGSILATGSNDTPFTAYFWHQPDGSLCDAGNSGCAMP